MIHPFDLDHNVMMKVKAICMVVGHSEVPRIPKDSREIREWYYAVRLQTMIYFPPILMILFSSSCSTHLWLYQRTTG